MSTKIERREDVNRRKACGRMATWSSPDPTKEDRAAEQHASADAHNPATAGVSSARSWSHIPWPESSASVAVRVLCAHSVTRSLTG